MQTVHKYAINWNDRDLVRMPRGARVIDVQLQGDALCAWALVDTESPMVARDLCVRGTGHDCEGLGSAFAWSVQGGQFVWHVFDRGER